MMIRIPHKRLWHRLAATRWPAICLMAALTAVGCVNRADTQTTPPRTVRVVRVNASAPADPASFAGEVTARHETELAFRVPGKLVARHMEVGDRVRKGQLLAQLDPADYRLAQQSLDAQLAASRAERDFARGDLARYQELLAQNLISLPEFDRHETLYKTAKERTAALQAQLDQAIRQLAYTDLVADRDGVIISLKVETGEVLGVGQPIGKLAQVDDKEVSIQVPEHRIDEVRTDQRVEAVLWADGERRLQGRIREIAPAADLASRTYAVKVTLLEGHDTTQLGMTAAVWFPSSLDRRIAVPLSTVFTPQSDPQQPRVWRVDERSQTVASVPVRLGELVGEEKVVVTGIAEGELIVSAGVHRLVEGQAVRLSEDSPAAAKVGELASSGERP